MKKILVISDGDIGDHFINRLTSIYSNDNIYYIIDAKSGKHRDLNPAKFKVFNFDPTSLYKIANILKMDFIQVVVALSSKVDTEQTIKNIRSIKKQLRLVVLDSFDIDSDDPNLLIINSNELLSSRLIDYLPNVPVIAQNVGQGEGEIMEVLVPFGSSFVYRHIGVIEQKKWRIVAIYRNQELILPTRRRMIQPNDLLLIVGDPSVLKSVYRAINRELGQFPEPFGSNLYLYIDMFVDAKDKITKLARRSLFIHKQFKHQLIIKVINPSDIDTLRYLKSLKADNIIIDICYENLDKNEVMLNDIKHYHIGLVILSRANFVIKKMRETLYKGNVPVLKLAERSLSKLKEAVIVLNSNRNLEKVSTTIFDISEQMGFNLELLNYKSENQEIIAEIVEHYYNLSTIFSQNIKITENEENPIRYLLQRENFLHALPFTQKIVADTFYSSFSTDNEKLYYRLDSYHQIFIPVQI